MVSSTPVDKSTGHSSVKKVRITFNEYIKLENASEKVIISPPQNEQPDMYTSGKSIVMTLFDTLQTNTTYTIDFADAIVDNNESNPMGNYTFSFSTGNEIDTMEVAGHVIMANNMEPVNSMLVGLYRIDNEGEMIADRAADYDSLLSAADTLLRTTPMQRVSRTNGDGHFCIKGVAPGRYRVYALNDMDGDYRFSQKSEMLAFDTIVVEPSFRPDLRHDTIWIDSTRYEKILHTPYTRFLPDDLVLRAFLEEGQSQYLLKKERLEPLKFTLFFTAPSDTLPLMEVMEGDSLRPLTGDWRRDGILAQTSLRYDTLTYWVTDTMLAYRDTLDLRLTYLETDSTGVLVTRVDTLNLVPRTTREHQIKEQEEQVDKWVKQQRKRYERYEKKLNKFLEQHPDSVYPHPERIDTARHLCPLYTTSVTVTIRPSGSISPAQNLTILCSEPIDVVDTAQIRFTLKQDTLQVPAPYIIRRDSLNPCLLHLYAEWRPDNKFKLELDSMAITTVYGWHAAPMSKDISVNNIDTYGTLFVQIANADILLSRYTHVPLPYDSTGDEASRPRLIVQLIDKSDKLISEQVADDKGRAEFYYLSPGQVFMRCYIDANGDGEWTTGDYDAGRQPEHVFYFPESLNIKAKWDLEQTWNPLGIEEMKQKPSVLIKQKEKQKKGSSAHERNLKRDKEGRF